jgi:WD40 repeat protein
VVLLLSVTACKKKVAAAPPPPPPVVETPPPPPTPAAAARINAFTVEPASIQRGQAATLGWSVANATDINIDQGVGVRAVTGEKGPFSGKVAFVSTLTGNKEVYLMDYDGFNARRLTGNRAINLNPDFSPSGKEIIYTSYKAGNPDLYRRELFTGAEARISASRGINIGGAWAPDGNRLASAGADNVVKIWDFEKGEKLRDVTMHQKQVTRLMYVGKTNQFLTCGGDGQVRLVNGDNGQNVRQFQGASDFLYSTAASADGTIVATGGEDGVVRIYEGATAKLVKAAVPPEKK